MNRLFLRCDAVAAVLSICLVSCAQGTGGCELPDSSGVTALPPETVMMGLEPLEFDDGTRTAVEADESTGLTFSWSDDDAVGVYASEGGFAKFSVSAGAGTSRAVFDGQGFKLTPGAAYSAVYPYDGNRTSSASLDLDYSGRTLNASTSLEDLVKYDPLYASAVADEAGSAFFAFHHVSSFVRFRFTFPKEGTFTSLDLVPTYGRITTSGSLDAADGSWTEASGVISDNIPLEGVSVSSSSEEVTMWLPMAPQDFTGNDIAALVHDSGGGLYSIRLEGKNLKSGKASRYSAALQEYSSSGSSPVRVTDRNTYTISDVPSGQYSGIARISDTRYAVVHDTQKGGGIYFFNLDFKPDGTLGSYSCDIPEGTSSAADTRDPEGIAYFAPANTLFVSGESDQRILEYDMDGYPTGRELAVPPDMAKGKAGGNTGFESLDYNAATGLFWTTTEENIGTDAALAQDGHQLLRLQSFNSDLTAGPRYFYLLDKAQKSSAGARNYAFGVPDILALDDGRLLVIEREAWIPNTGYSDIISKTVVYLKIYEVDPVNDRGGILNKRLVKSWQIDGGFSFANYEGIGFGPVIGGKQSILMVNDSQDRYGTSVGGFYISVLKDYLKVLTLD